jgi:pimeloyl-ACP methyl ester carboxylesterase
MEAFLPVVSAAFATGQLHRPRGPGMVADLTASLRLRPLRIGRRAPGVQSSPVVSPSIRRFLVRLLRTYILLVVVIFFAQRWMIYHPFRGSETEMIKEAFRDGLVPWKNGGGEIIGWRSTTVRWAKPSNKLIVFHGNAGNALYREPYVAGFESVDKGRAWEVFLFEYPGYGARPGKTSRETFNTAAQAAVKELLGMDDRPLFVLGESLGSGVACDVAAKEQGVKGIVLVTPFARLADVAQSAVPFVPAGLMLRDRWDNLAALPRSRGPVAVLIAGCDEVVGCDQGEQVFASLGNRSKKRWFFPDARHNTLEFQTSAAWWNEVSDFLTKALPF